jgi:N-acetyltransferase
MISVTPVTLEGRGVRLEPLAESHHDALVAAATDGTLWELWYTKIPDPSTTRGYISEALQGQRDGHMLPWVVRDLSSGDVVGTTRFHDINPAVDRVEIGYTWYGASRHRSSSCSRMRSRP